LNRKGVKDAKQAVFDVGGENPRTCERVEQRNMTAKDIISRDTLRGCLGTHFRNSLKRGRLDKINPLF